MGLLDDAIREHLDLKRQRGADPTEIERMEREALGPVRREPTIGSSRFDAPEQHDAEQFEHEHYEPHDFGPEHHFAHEPLGEHIEPEHFDERLPDEPLGYHDSTAPRTRHDRPHSTPRLDLAGERTLPDQPGVPDEPQPKRRFLRRNRPASLAESQPTQEPTHEEPLVRRDDPLEHHEPWEHHEPMEHHEPADINEPTERHDVVESNKPPARQEQGAPPHLEFDSPPRRPRFTAEPPGSSTPPSDESALPDESTRRGADPAEPREGPDEDVLEETPEFLQDTPEHDRLWFEQRPPRDFDFDG